MKSRSNTAAPAASLVVIFNQKLRLAPPAGMVTV